MIFMLFYLIFNILLSLIVAKMIGSGQLKSIKCYSILISFGVSTSSVRGTFVDRLPENAVS